MSSHELRKASIDISDALLLMIPNGPSLEKRTLLGSKLFKNSTAKTKANKANNNQKLPLPAVLDSDTENDLFMYLC